MKKFLLGLMVLGSISAFAEEYPCTDYLRSYADMQLEKGDNALEIGISATFATLGFATPLAMPVAIIVENAFDKKSRLARNVMASFGQSSFSEEQWKEIIIRNIETKIRSGRSERLKAINEERLKDVQPMMTQQEFEEKYPLDKALYEAFKANFKSLSINLLLANLEKVSKEAITYEQLRKFLLETRKTNYFCQSNESIKLSKQRLNEIANDVLRY